jgi:hypothetical protein
MIKKEHEKLLIKELEDLLKNARKKVSTTKVVTMGKQIFCYTIPEVNKEAEEIVKTEKVRLENIIINSDDYGNMYLYWKDVKDKTKEEIEADVSRYFIASSFTRIYKLLTPIGYMRQCNVNMTIDLYKSMLSKDYVSILKYYGTRFK